MQKLRVAVAGVTETSVAVSKVILARRSRYADAFGMDVRLIAHEDVAACLTGDRGFDALCTPRSRLDEDPVEDLLSTRPDVFIEAGSTDLSSVGSSRSSIEKAVRAGCDVVATLPGSLVNDGVRLRNEARDAGRLLKISGATGGALPAMDLLQRDLAGSHVTKIEGIFSSETNDLLDAMMKFGMSLQEALDNVPEANARGDLREQADGDHTARILLLLANFGLNADLDMNALEVRGISRVNARDIAHWHDQAASPRLVGTLTCNGNAITGTVDVKPFYPGDQMALVRGRCKAIRIVTREMGEIVVSACGSQSDAVAASALRDFELIMQERCRR
jgi:homoserine dehydrogenase